MTEAWNVLVGDCVAVMKTLPDNSVDAIVTDPPYGLGEPPPIEDVLRAWLDGKPYHAKGGGFMGKEWDSFVPGPEYWREVLRVAKPGAHLLAFSGTRTYDVMGIAIRMAGWEPRDTCMWVYGSGFPKSHSVYKATHDAVESRYGNLRCDCLDTGDGCASWHGCGCENCAASRPTGGSCAVQAAAFGTSGVSSISSPGIDAVRELWDNDKPQTQGTAEKQKAVLLADMRGCGAEEAGHGHASVWSGVEEYAGEDSAAGSSVSGVRRAADQQCAARPSSETVSNGWHEQAGESGSAVRFVPPCYRSDHDVSDGIDPHRCEPRRAHHDDCGGRRAAVARVCSWCGRPDREWLDALKSLGTALKPAYEPIILARKPLVGTVAANVAQHGVGGINIDGCRIDTMDDLNGGTYATMSSVDGVWNTMAGPLKNACGKEFVQPTGRWPANVLLDEDAAEALDAQTGVLTSGTMRAGQRRKATRGKGGYNNGMPDEATRADTYGDSGGASRFFYCAKASKSERNAGVEGKNDHPTVKPIDLMRYLVRLVTPPGGLVLDPFNGSGTTGCAAIAEGFRYLGIEQSEEYAAIARQRIQHAQKTAEPKTAPVKSSRKPELPSESVPPVPGAVTAPDWD